MAKKKSNGLTLSQLVSKHSLNKAHLASLMKMPSGTFKNKLSDTQTGYRFTETELERLKDILLDMAADIQDLAGVSFKEALSKITKKQNNENRTAIN